MNDSRRIIRFIIEIILAHSYNDFDFCVEKEVGRFRSQMGTEAQNFRLIWGLFHLSIIVQQITSKLSGLIRKNHFSFLVISVGQEFGSCSMEQFLLGDCMTFQSETGSWQEASFPHHMGISVRRLGWLPPEQVIRGGQSRSHMFFVTLPQKSHMSFL